MKAKFIFRQDGTAELKTIEGVAGHACSKKMEELKQLLPGQVDPTSVQKTNDYYKTAAQDRQIEIG